MCICTSVLFLFSAASITLVLVILHVPVLIGVRFPRRSHLSSLWGCHVPVFHFLSFSIKQFTFMLVLVAFSTLASHTGLLLSSFLQTTMMSFFSTDVFGDTNEPEFSLGYICCLPQVRDVSFTQRTVENGAGWTCQVWLKAPHYPCRNAI